MKKILRPGNTKKKLKCANCSCVFTYDPEDVVRSIAFGPKVSCPTCHTMLNTEVYA